jgi:hypothetical protein
MLTPLRYPICLVLVAFNANLTLRVGPNASARQTFCLEGDINMALREKGPIDPVDVPRFLDST